MEELDLIDAKEGAMGVSLTEMLNQMPADRRQAVEARTQELVAEEMTLRDLRKAMGQTQVELAAKLGLKQENISRVEQRTDMLLSTLDGYLRALGGRLRLVAEFEGRPTVTLTEVKLAGLRGLEPKATPARTTKRQREVAPSS